MELERMTLTSASGSKLNLDALYQIMPSCFTEVRDDKTGKISHKINFTTLRELLGDNAYEGADEEYGFSWVGKNAARREAASSINKTLRPCPEESVNWDSTENLYIEGDNLEVLKLLQKSYLGKVKMIYIDPPYNTGNDFVYIDDFKKSSFDENLANGNVDEFNNCYRKNLDSNSRFHSDWCSMIYERLLVARALLSEDGVIFISIDDNEAENLRKICDEVFGEKNFIANCVRRTINSGKHDATTIAPFHEYVLMYSKSIDKIRLAKKPKDEAERDRLYKEKDEFENERGRFYITQLNKNSLQYSDGLNYPIKGPDGVDIWPGEGFHDKVWIWRWSKQKVQWGIENGYIVFKKSGEKYKVYTKSYEFRDKDGNPINRNNPYSTLEFIGKEYANFNATPELEKVFNGKKYFDFPKSQTFISELIRIANLSDNDLLLDFFSGSATTAHATMLLNAEDGGNRKFIMVQLPEVTDEKSEARKAGYNTICEIGKERIRRAGKKIKEEAGEKAANLDTGFRVFKCEDSFMNDVYFAPSELKQEDLFSQIENIKDGTSDLSLLFGCMLDWGVQLSLPLSHFTVAGKTIHNVNDGDLVACFAEDINEEVISAIAELSPLRVVFRDSCFSESAFKMNLFELFKQKCGWSEEQVRDKVRVI